MADPQTILSPTTKEYRLAVYNTNQQLIAAEFIEVLATISLLYAIETWTDQGHEIRIKRLIEKNDQVAG